MFFRNILTVSTSGSSGMEKRLQKKIKSSNKQKKQILVQKIFSGISEKYDLMNDLMSFGLHRYWKKEFANLIDIKTGDSILDLASGSGDLLKLLGHRSDCNFIGYDSSVRMLKQAKKKIKNKNIKFVKGVAENLPFKSNSFDIIIVSFGLRNFYDIKKSLREIKRVLKKGCKFYCLEFSHINSFSFRKLFYAYSKIIPLYGKVLLNNSEAYDYLIDSIKKFPNQVELTQKLLDSGFKNIEVIDILDGLAAIHISET